eukprot:XP_011665121.1 PREDICTED: norrin-like [Strongylocentrotus purpuratus]
MYSAIRTFMESTFSGSTRHFQPQSYKRSSVTMTTHLLFILTLIILTLVSTSTSYTPSSILTTSSNEHPKCVRYYHTERISHPRKPCQSKIILMSRCAGQCEMASSADPVVSFKSHLRHPFKYRCQSCQDHISIMKAVLLRCQGNERVYATYRYILSCECASCKR